MSKTEPALPWGLPKQDEAPKVSEATEKPVDLKAGQRVRVRFGNFLGSASFHLVST